MVRISKRFEVRASPRELHWNSALLQKSSLRLLLTEKRSLKYAEGSLTRRANFLCCIVFWKYAHCSIWPANRIKQVCISYYCMLVWSDMLVTAVWFLFQQAFAFVFSNQWDPHAKKKQSGQDRKTFRQLAMAEIHVVEKKTTRQCLGALRFFEVVDWSCFKACISKNRSGFLFLCCSFLLVGVAKVSQTFMTMQADPAA